MAHYESNEIDGIHTIRCPEIIDSNPDLETCVKNWLSSTAEAHVLDLKSVVEFRESGYRPFVLFKRALKDAGKRLFIINASREVDRQLRRDGLMSSVFILVKNMDEVLANIRSKSAKQGINVEFVNPFISATLAVLDTQANTPATAGRPYLKKAENLPMEIAGVISLVISKICARSTRPKKRSTASTASRG